MHRRTEGRMLVWWWWGCASLELARLEATREQLTDQHRGLQGQVEALRDAMLEQGLVAPGAGPPPGEGGEGGEGRRPKAGKVKLNDHQLPERSLAGTYLYTFERTGTPAALPPLPTAERADGVCGMKFVLESLKPISDFVLNKNDLGKSSPILLLEDGELLPTHALPKDFQDRCAGASRHAGNVVLFSPTGESPDDWKKHTYSLQLATEVPLPRGDDERPMFWVYPGTTLRFDFAGGWDDSLGDLWVDLGGRTSGAAASPLTLLIAGEEHVVEEDDLLLSVMPDLPESAWSIEISSPEDGPFAVLNVLTVGNAKNALVLTGPRAFKESKK